MRSAAAALVAAVLAGGLLGGCEAEPQDRDVVAFLVADAGGDRWRELDLPGFADGLESACPDCVQITRDAGGDAATQRRQFADVVRAGADVVVLHPVSSETGEELVAGSRVPVVAYDRPIPGAERLVAPNAARSAAGIARALDGLLPGGRAPVLVVSDGPGGLTERVLDRLGDRVRVRAGLPPQRHARAGTWVVRQLERGPAAAVLTGDDGVAQQVARALAEAGVDPADRPVVTGYGGDLAAVRRLVLRTQAVTVHASRSDQALAAADVAAALARGQQPPEATRAVGGVPATLLTPTTVTARSLTNTLVRQGVYSIDEICVARVLARCERLGLR